MLVSSLATSGDFTSASDAMTLLTVFFFEIEGFVKSVTESGRPYLTLGSSLCLVSASKYLFVVFYGCFLLFINPFDVCSAIRRYGATGYCSFLTLT